MKREKNKLISIVALAIGPGDTCSSLHDLQQKKFIKSLSEFWSKLLSPVHQGGSMCMNIPHFGVAFP